MATPESLVKKSVVELLKKEGIYHFFAAANGYGRAGIPDIICCVDGSFVAIECKAGKNKPTALQLREMQRIDDAGGVSLVVTDDPVTFRLLGWVIQQLKEHK